MEISREQLIKLGDTGSARRELKAMVFTDMVGSTQMKQELGDAPL